MARVNNLVETESHDNTAVKGNENQQGKSEKLGSIAVESWKGMEKTFKDAPGKASSEKNSLNHDGGTKDDKFLTFDDPYKTGKNEKNDNSSGMKEKKMMSEDDIIGQKKSDDLDDGTLIKMKKETAVEQANLIQKKKELAAAGKPGATVEGTLEFSPDKPKIPADGGLKDKGSNEWQNSGKPFDGGKKPSLDGGLKDPEYYMQKL